MSGGDQFQSGIYRRRVVSLSEKNSDGVNKLIFVNGQGIKAARKILNIDDGWNLQKWSGYDAAVVYNIHSRAQNNSSTHLLPANK